MRKIMKKRYFLAFLFTAICLTASASCGTTDYSGSSGKLYDMLLYAIAAVLSIYSATSIYIKLQAGEEGFTKSVMVLVGSCLFMIGATIVMPAFFGFNFG